jgi:hypothetical protein
MLLQRSTVSNSDLIFNLMHRISLRGVCLFNALSARTRSDGCGGLVDVAGNQNEMSQDFVAISILLSVEIFDSCTQSPLA